MRFLQGYRPRYRYSSRVSTHDICQKIGKKGFPKYTEYPYKCRTCNVSYKDNQKSLFYKNKFCPCCHRLLRLFAKMSKYKINVKRIE